MREFYDQWYSSNIMSLCLLSNLDFEDMEKLARDHFESITNKHVEVPDLGSPHPYPSSH